MVNCSLDTIENLKKDIMLLSMDSFVILVVKAGRRYMAIPRENMILCWTELMKST